MNVKKECAFWEDSAHATAEKRDNLIAENARLRGGVAPPAPGEVRGCFCHTCGQIMPDTVTAKNLAKAFVEHDIPLGPLAPYAPDSATSPQSDTNPSNVTFNTPDSAKLVERLREKCDCSDMLLSPNQWDGCLYCKSATALEALTERAETCERFELRHRKQIDLLLGENRIRDIALEALRTECDALVLAGCHWEDQSARIAELEKEVTAFRAEKDEILEYARAKTGQLEVRCQELESDRDNWRAKAGG